MCGICGIIGSGAREPKVRAAVRSMMDVLAHRGPDGHGEESGEHFAFGHRRLAIIDLEHGTQPMQSEDGLVTLVYNGEIYNYIELRQGLIQQGERFRTFSDTEVLLKLYERYGEACVKKLNGMFAFAVYDQRRELFFAARDHFGIKPFYYVELPGGGLAFASEIKALFKVPGVRASVEQGALNQYMTLQFCLNGSTLFDGIKRLQPAETLAWTPDGDIKKWRYWSPDFEVDGHHTEAFFTDTLLMLLQDSVRGQLRSDVPVGAYLSGGLDSSVVTALAAASNDDFKSFTGKFSEGEAYDESRYARLMAEAAGADYHEVVPRAEEFADLLPRLIWHMDEPAAGPGLFPQFMVSRMAKEHVTVVLGGQGGDEIFGGYARYQVAYLEQCLKGAIFETQEEGSHVVTMDTLVPNLPLLKQYVPLLKSFWKDGLFEPMDDRYFRLLDRSHDLKDMLSPDMLAVYDREAVLEKFKGVFNHPQTKSYVNKMTRFDQVTLLQALLQVEDRVSMAVSLESRVPMLDRRIVDLVSSAPPSLKFRGGETKYLLKNAVAGVLPGEIVGRKDKMGFPVPLREWMDGPLREFVADTLLSRRSRERGVFRPEGLERAIAGESRFGRQVWGALCLELWHQIFIDGEGPTLSALSTASTGATGLPLRDEACCK